MTRVENHKKISGQWIWLSSNSSNETRAVSSFVFTRKFQLEALGEGIFLDIASHANYQLFLNGKMIHAGPSPALNGRVMIHSCSLTPFLQVGENQLLILFSCVDIPMASQGLSLQFGFAAQMRVRDDVVMPSHATWQWSPISAMLAKQCRMSPSQGFAERSDLNLSSFDQLEDLEWQKSINVKACEEEDFLDFPSTELIPEESVAKAISLQGTSEAASASLFIPSPGSQEASSHYAVCYFYSPSDKIRPITVLSDQPYRLFCNDEVLISHGGSEMKNADPYQKEAFEERMTQSSCFVEGPCHFRAGWNKLAVLIASHEHSPGLTLTFPESQREELLFRHLPDFNADSGFLLSRTLHGLLQDVSSDIETLNEENLRPVELFWDVDFSAQLLAYNFRAKFYTRPMGSLDLHQGDYVVYDFADLRDAYLSLEIQAGSADEIAIVYGSKLERDSLASFHPRQGRKADSLILREGKNNWTSHDRRGFRYVMIVATKVNGACSLAVPKRTVFSLSHGIRASFECSDELINKIHQVNVQTTKTCTGHLLVDSPISDKCQYITDAASLSLANLHLSGDDSSSKKALREFFAAQTVQGVMPGAAPSGFYFNSSDYHFHLIVWLHKHLLYTGDHDFAEECLPYLLKLLDHYHKRLDPELNVLADGKDAFIDHEDLDRRGPLTALNAFYCRALYSASWILHFLGDERTASLLTERAETLSGKVRELCWDERRKLFRDSYAPELPGLGFGLHSNVFAMYGALVESEKYEALFDRLLLNELPYFTLPTTNLLSPFFCGFLLENAYSLNRRQWAFDFIKDYWGGMVHNGAETWHEFYNPTVHFQRNYDHSSCCANGLSPSLHLFADIVGIRPGSPGFKQVIFSPGYEQVERVKATVPTVRGDIELEWSYDSTAGLAVNMKSDFPFELLFVAEEGMILAEWQLSSKITLIERDKLDT